MKKNKGITLISLTITIIVLLILAGVSVAMLTGNNSIIKQAVKAGEQTKIAEWQEKLELAISEYMLDHLGEEVNLTNYLNYIQNEKGYITQENIANTKQANAKNITVENTYVFLVEYFQDTENLKITYRGTVEELTPKITAVNILSKTLDSVEIQVNTKAMTNPTYKYYITEQGTSYGAAQDSTSNTHKFINLPQGKIYTIKVEVISEDATLEQEITVKMADIPELSAANTNFEYSPNSWTSGSVTVTIISNVVTDNPDLKLQYKTELKGQSGEVENWTDYTGPVTLTRNQEIYAKAVDTNGQGKDGYATGTVDKIDTSKPTIGTATGSSTVGNTGTVTLSDIQDTGSGLKGVFISTQKAAPTVSSEWIPNTSSSYTYTAEKNGTYNAWAIDNANNISELKSCTVSELVDKVHITVYSNATVNVGTTVTPEFVYAGEPESISFSSSNTDIATVSRLGYISGIAPGTAQITVTLTNYDGTTETATCTVTVNP